MSQFYKKCILAVFLVALITGNTTRSSAQTPGRAVADSVRGTVVDDNGKPLRDVKITNPATGSSAQTNEAGIYAIRANAGQTLIAELPGFYLQEIRIKQGGSTVAQLTKRYLTSSLVPANAGGKASVDERDGYVEVLHGRQLKKNLLQSVSTVSTNQLVTSPSAQFLAALPGRLMGLNIGFTNGSPGLDGSGLSYNVRTARGANIILIDGVQRGYLSIDPDQIESVSVLKDALSTVMFGQRSSNGIISIVTKKGDRGTPRLSFNVQSAFQRPLALPKPLSADQYATLYNEAQQNDAGAAAVTPRYSQADIDAYRNGTDPYNRPNVDWYNTVLNEQSMLTRYNFNVQGSGKGFRYFVDLDNLKETGLLKTTDANVYNTNAQADRYIVRTNLGVDVTPTTQVQLNLFGRIGKNNQPGGGTSGILASLVNTPRNAYPVFNADGSLAGTSAYGQNVNIYGQSVSRGYQFQDVRDMAVDLQVTQKLDFALPGLYLRAQGTYNNSTVYNTTRAKDFAVFQLQTNGTYNKIGNTSEQGNSGSAGDRTMVSYLEAALGYEHAFGKHNLNALVLADRQSTLPYASGNLPENYTDLAARITYNWDDKYMAEAAGSYAGYNYFAPDKRWFPFGAVGLGWNVHREAFMQEHAAFISNLKLRATYGLTGQANAGYFTYIQTYWTPSSNTNNNDGYYFGSTGVGVERSTGQNALTNPALEPEKAKKANAGIDLGLFGNKFTLTAEYFKNKFFDLVGSPGTQTTLLGTGFPSKNIQKFDYWGHELSAAWQSKVRSFNYFVTGNFSYVQSKVVFNDEVPKAYEYQRGTGKQVNLLYGYVATGLFQSYAEINDPKTAVFSSTPRSTLRPGDIRYKDLNGDGVIDNNDNGAIGSGKPTVYFGGTAGFSYKGFDVSVLVQGTANRQLALGGPAGQNGDFFNGFGNGGNNNAYEYNLGRWTPQTAATATAPRLWLGNNVNNQQVSTYWLRNADFVRLKNAEIGYTFPVYFSRKIGIPSLRVFSNGLNLVTWSELFDIRKDIDPEAMGAAYPTMRVFNFGVNAKF
ncbi:SusC/RagA family TonB-linked outer membrane protein [Hufsiella ginkgonis]|uniref:SusC/RagA family TonB-linked outer membrane protein n=1 Tax=Hufsiella ginkgonis TaxID=2695274 RepID=A0A7K1XZL3_9SPHI|nr:SusC/RagA family TonB-linked outer membrane protein [Hufsiella ginkgonis]MXV16392.1 SusC/RagA family TonB-linked outer membrane protein [Hufsiella ginkgonis]